MAAAKGWGPVAPFFIDQEAPEPPGGLPRPGRIRSNLPNNHLQYALTWYGLALVLVVVFVVWARGRTSERMDAMKPAGCIACRARANCAAVGFVSYDAGGQRQPFLGKLPR